MPGTLTVEAGLLALRCPDPQLARALRSVPGRRFDARRRAWLLPPSAARPALRLAERFGLDVAPEALALEPAIGPQLSVEAGVARLRGAPARLSRALQAAPGIRWRRALSAWEAPPELAGRLLALCRAAGCEPLGAAELSVKLERLAEAEAEARALDAELPEMPGLARELRPHQRAAAAFLAERRRVLLADPVGLGKTLSALAAIELAGAWPAVVMCPQSIRVNWLREIRASLPARQAALCHGSRPPASLGPVDIVVCHYEIAYHWRLLLRRLRPRAFIADESQLLKEPSTLRARAAAEVAAAVPDGGLRICLSATPVLNRRGEYASQLAVLGRLDELGGASAVSSEPAIARRLRAAGAMMRRSKEDVLPGLPPPQHYSIVIEGEASAMAEYREAEGSFLAWLRQQRGRAAQERASRAEELVRLGWLRQLAARAKHPAARVWISAYLDSQPGAKLLLFAHNTEALRAAGEAFACPVIRGGQRPAERMALVDAFQSPAGPRLMALGLGVGGVGLTLTAASDVVFLQDGWTPGIHDQALGRCHGRLNDPHGANGYHLLCAETVDLAMDRLIAEKRAEVADATDGFWEARDGAAERGSVASALLNELAERAGAPPG